MEYIHFMHWPNLSNINKFVFAKLGQRHFILSFYLCISTRCEDYSQLPELLLGSTTEPTLRPLKRFIFVCLSLRLISC